MLYAGGNLDRPSQLMHQEWYWENPLVVTDLPRDDVYDLEVAGRIVDLAYGAKSFETVNVFDGQSLPVLGQESEELLQLVIDGRTVANGYDDVHPAEFNSDLEAREFDMLAYQLLVAGPTERRAAARLVWRIGDSLIELSRLVAYFRRGIHAPFAGRPASALMEPVHTVPNIVLPDVVVGQTFQPPTIGRRIRQEFKVVRAKVLTPFLMPPD